MRRHHSIPIMLACVVFLQACNFPANLIPPTPGLPPTPTAMPTATPTEIIPTSTSTPTTPPTTTATLPATSTRPPASPSPSATALPPSETPLPTETATLTPIPTPIDFPKVTFNTNANCRLGPAKNYFLKTSFLTGRSTIAEGRNQDGSWLWAKAIEGYCWVSVSTIKDPVSYTFLPVVEFPSLPEAPTQLVVTSKDCQGRITISLRWNNVTGETGYYLYRNGIMLIKLRADAFEYTDYPPLASEYFYEIEPFNDYGLSLRYGQTVQGCK